MVERSTRSAPPRASSAASPAATPRPDGRRTQVTKRSISLRRTLWGSLTIAMIVFLAWFVLWANEAGGMLP